MSSSAATELADEKKSQDQEEPVQVTDEAAASEEKPEVDLKALLDETTNASVLSASDIRSAADDTTTAAAPGGAEETKNGVEDEVEAKPAGEEDSNVPASADSDNSDWVDVLGNGQLMKKVCSVVS